MLTVLLNTSFKCLQFTCLSLLTRVNTGHMGECTGPCWHSSLLLPATCIGVGTAQVSSLNEPHHPGAHTPPPHRETINHREPGGDAGSHLKNNFIIRKITSSEGVTLKYRPKSSPLLRCEDLPGQKLCSKSQNGELHRTCLYDPSQWLGEGRWELCERAAPKGSLVGRLYFWMAEGAAFLNCLKP